MKIITSLPNFTILLLLFTLLSCSHMEDPLKIIPVLAPDIPISSFTDQERVCYLIDETVDLLTTTNSSLDDYFDEELWDLLEIENPTLGEIDEILDLFENGLNNMLTADASFATAFNNVLSLDLTHEEFIDYAEECDVEQFTGGNVIIRPRWCLFCNSTACARNIALNTIAQHGFAGESGLLFSLGVWVHCDH